ncbi:MAG TPA: class I SAM-dependent methyltransferase [Terriglobales bacterium]|nr:class I SAM-dependent methyltransferase [Terriglobales bacterium]
MTAVSSSTSIAEQAQNYWKTTRSKNTLVRMLKEAIRTAGIRNDESILVIGGGNIDIVLLDTVGMKNYTLSNMTSAALARTDRQDKGTLLNVEDLQLEDNSFDVVFAHDVLHHCYTPHKALREMMRVARRCVIFFDPNDSAFVRMLVRLNLSFQYETGVVASLNYSGGGVMGTAIPNYTYRWTPRELEKTANCANPERRLTSIGYQYWDFIVNEEGLKLRRETRIGAITRIVGPGNFLRAIRGAQWCLNLWGPIRKQGNKFCGVVIKGNLQPWMTFDGKSLSRDWDFKIGRQAS